MQWIKINYKFKIISYISIFFLLVPLIMSTKIGNKKPKYTLEIFETSAAGNKLTKVNPGDFVPTSHALKLDPSVTFQEITGFGGAFTEASAYLLNQLSPENRVKIMEAYFSKKGANYSLTRTHINSCDFSLNNYSYAPVSDDRELKYFSIEEDKDDLIPMIKHAQSISEDGFRIIASPWTAPPWMKDNGDYVGGKLMPKFRDTWALFFCKYLDAYKAEGIDIWSITVENEPHGNGDNWESMHYTPEEMTQFVQHHLGPKLEQCGHEEVLILGYDQNRAELKKWVDVMFENEETSRYFAGTAIHWYESTYDYYPDALDYAREKAPDKYLIQTEACVDAEVPHWKDDSWYWKKEATDWGWDWASEEEKHLHPKYVPVYRYARDIIGCLNHWVDGWVDWNMVLDRQGGPNWFKNWCVAPVIVDPDKDEVYFTPLYYTMAHFSKFIRPGAKRIHAELSDEELMVTAAQNPDNSIAVVVFNETDKSKEFGFEYKELNQTIRVNPKSLQTILIKSKSN